MFDGDVNDSSNNNYDGELYGATLTTDKNNHSNSAYSFDGSDDYIDLGDNTLFNLQDKFTISGWFKADTTTSNPYSPTILSKDDGGMHQGWTLRINYQNGKLEWVKNDQTVPITSINTLFTNTWYHYVITYDENTIKKYLNGNMEYTSYSSHASNTRNTKIGSHDVYGRYFDGALDEISFWNKSFSSQEVNRIYNYGISYN